nr:putative phage/plasmid DNA primase [Oedogonium sp. 210]
MNFYLHLTLNDFISHDSKGNERIISPVRTAELLLKYSNLQYFLFFPAIGSFYLYDHSTGIYLKFSMNSLLTLTCRILKLTGDYRLYSYEYVCQVVNNLLISEKNSPNLPVFTLGYIVFNNGVLRLCDNYFMEYTPELFLTTKVYGE